MEKIGCNPTELTLEAPERSSYQPELFDYWQVTKGKYRPPDEARIKQIEKYNDSPQIRIIELTMYCLELADKVRPQDSAEDSINLAYIEELVGDSDRLEAFYNSLSPKQRQELMAVIDEMKQEEALTDAVQKKVESAYELCAPYSYPQQDELRQMTSRYNSKNVAALRGIESMGKRHLIGPVTRRLLESIIRTLILEQEGETPPRHLKTV